MAVSTERWSSGEGLGPPVETTRREDMVTVLLGGWLSLGGFVDGYAHRSLDTPETFFTPWHGILYTGFLATAGWVLWLVIQGRQRSHTMIEAIPAGYGTTVVGIGVFGAGGIGDMFWHILFGIETSIDALLSPTHLLLLLGAVLMLSGPLRAAWLRSSGRVIAYGEFLPPLLAVTLAAAELGFFFQYMDGLSVRFMQVPYLPGLEEGYFELVAGIASILITTVILMGGLLLLMRRWTPPFGSGLVLFGLYGMLMEILEGYRFPEDVVAPLAGGLVADLAIKYLSTEARGALAVRVVAFVVPVAMWGVRFAVFERYSDINWPVSVWTGAIVFAGLAGVSLSLLAYPPTTSAVVQSLSSDR